MFNKQLLCQSSERELASLTKHNKTASTGFLFECRNIHTSMCTLTLTVDFGLKPSKLPFAVQPGGQDELPCKIHQKIKLLLLHCSIQPLPVILRYFIKTNIIYFVSNHHAIC